MAVNVRVVGAIGALDADQAIALHAWLTPYMSGGQTSPNNFPAGSIDPSNDNEFIMVRTWETQALAEMFINKISEYPGLTATIV